MAITIVNKDFKMTVETPGEKYTGSRFDWNGTIIQIVYKSIPLLGQEKKLFKRNSRICGRGLHNEFGIRDCIGYDDISEGDWFPKIGTGWLKKDSKPYFFYTQYEMEPLTFSIHRPTSTQVVFNCNSGERNGYAYVYTKTITLENNGFEIFYSLENLGSKNLSTTEYVHNFFNPGNGTTNSHLSLHFNWNFEKDTLAHLSVADALEITDSTINFSRKPEGEFFVGGVWNARTAADTVSPAPGQWALIDKKNQIVITETDSFVPYDSDVWGHSKAISPELFYRFSVEPGETVNWQRRYFITQVISE